MARLGLSLRTTLMTHGVQKSDGICLACFLEDSRCFFGVRHRSSSGFKRHDNGR